MEIAAIAIACFLCGAGSAWYIATATIAELRRQVTDRERMIALRDRREAKMFAAVSTKLGVPSDPDLGPPRTISRSKQTISQLHDQRRNEEEKQRLIKGYNPVAAAAAEGELSCPE